MARFPVLTMPVGSLVLLAQCGLPLALGSQRLWRLGCRRAAPTAEVALGSVTVAATLVVGPPGPLTRLLAAGR